MCCHAQAALSLLLCSCEVVSAGILMARGHIGYLVAAMLLTLGGMAGFCHAARSQAWGLQGVWWGAPLLLLNARHAMHHCIASLICKACGWGRKTLLHLTPLVRVCRACRLLRVSVCTEHWNCICDSDEGTSYR